MKKTDIYKMFTGEVIAISTIGSMIGVVSATYVLYQLTTVSYYANKIFRVNSYSTLTVIIIVYLFNLLVGLLPCALTLRKTPAEIMSRNDV